MVICKYVDIMSAVNKGKKKVFIRPGTIISPLAKETADIYGIKISEEIMRKPLITGNWKMNKTNSEAVLLVNSLKEKVKDTADVDVMIAPPFTSLTVVSEVLKGSNVALGAQNFYFESSGAYTGEISASMLRECGCSWIIIGHSERRQYFGCTDEIVNKKLKAAIAAGLNPIVCIGETLKEREENKTFDILSQQLNIGLKDLAEEQYERLTIAYEPLWAIGTGRTATPEQAEEAHKYIRNTLSGMYGEETAQSTRILYGGSIKPDNITDIMARENVDGGLVGGASLDADTFARIVKFKDLQVASLKNEV